MWAQVWRDCEKARLLRAVWQSPHWCGMVQAARPPTHESAPPRPCLMWAVRSITAPFTGCPASSLFLRFVSFHSPRPSCASAMHQSELRPPYTFRLTGARALHTRAPLAVNILRYRTRWSGTWTLQYPDDHDITSTEPIAAAIRNPTDPGVASAANIER